MTGWVDEGKEERDITVSGCWRGAKSASNSASQSASTRI